MNKKKKSKKSGENNRFEINGLVFAQISISMLILIILLFIRLLHTPAFKDIMTEYNSLFGEDLPLSVIADRISDGLVSPSGQKETGRDANTTQTSTSAGPASEEEIPDESEPPSEKTSEKINTVSVNKNGGVSMINEMELPVKKGRLTSKFGYRTSPITGEYCLHGGIDLAADMGTNIYAALDGRVTASVEDEDIGYYIKIDHGSGVVTAYGHCSKLIAKEGDSVRKGDLIALVGSTGNSTGPHTHFEVRVNGEKIDPARVLDLSQLDES